MIKTTIFLLATVLFSCRRPTSDNELPNTTTSQVTTEIASGLVGDPNKTPDLVPVTYQLAYEGYPFGILAQPPTLYPNYTTYWGVTANWIQFHCPVENIGVPSANPWSPLVWTGSDYTGADFVWQGEIKATNFLVITLFKNGLPISNYNKAAENSSGWLGVDEDHIFNYNPALDNRSYLIYSTATYDGVFHPMFADTYFNLVKVSDPSTLPDGRYALRVAYNEEDYTTHQRLFRENRYDNNVAVVGLVINGNTSTWDSTTIAENRTNTVSNLTGKFVAAGKIKSVTLNWACPYHGTGIIHKFRIKKDGVVIADDLWNEGYVDTTVSGRFKSAVYSVEIKIEGLGISPTSEVTVKK